ncbi:hypothetical protein ID866_6687 [Astraeus odoratus]|nr:hypothetical protein ID866_6687 [Astraeus odoratus]
MKSTAKWLQGQKGFEDVAALARDCMKFIQTFVSAVSQSTPHLYISTLPFLPSNALLDKVLHGKFCGIAEVAVGHPADWPNIDIHLLGHTSWVRSVAFSPDGTKIVSGSSDNTVRMWDVERGVQIGSPLLGHTEGVASVSFSPDGIRITVRVWDASQGVQIGSPLQGHTDWVRSVAFFPDGTKVASGSDDNTVRVWDAERGMQKWHMEHPVRMCDDGWVRGPKDELLLWVPCALQDPFYSVYNTLVIPKR